MIGQVSKKYLFINKALSGTGGARVILNLAVSLINHGHSVSILIDRKDNIDYEIDPRINIYLRKKRKIIKINSSNRDNIYPRELKSNFKRKIAPQKLIMYIKRVISIVNFLNFYLEKKTYNSFIEKNNFDIVVNNNIYSNLERILFEKSENLAYFVNFHNSPNEVFSRKDFFSIIPLHKIFSNVNLLAVSNGAKDELQNISFLSKNRKKTIYNPFDFNQIIEKANNTRSDNIDDYIILVASLTQRKRIDRALNAMKYITESYSDIKLLILGCGNLQYQLEEFVNKNNLDRNVMFLGFQENPYQYIYNAKLLMLTSDSEGLPTVLIESLILGTPVISTNCPTGPKEILEPWGDECLINLSDNENRIIEEIADKSIKLLKKNYSKEYIISKSNLGRFESETIVSQWEKL